MPRYLRGIVGITKGALDAPTTFVKKTASGVLKAFLRGARKLVRPEKAGAAALVITMLLPVGANAGNKKLMEEYDANGRGRIAEVTKGQPGTYLVPPAADRVILKEQVGTPSNAPLRGGAAETDEKRLSAELTAARDAAVAAQTAEALRVQKEILREQAGTLSNAPPRGGTANTHEQMVKERTGRDAATLSKIMDEAMKGAKASRSVGGASSVRGSVGPRPGGN